MPFSANAACRLHWQIAGAADQPAVVLLNSIGTDLSLWDAVVDQLASSFRLLRIDTRGHGQSDAPAGDYDLPLLVSDVVAVMADAGMESALIAGVSLGGMIAMQLALDHPDAVSGLVLICTSATMDPTAWQARIDAVRLGGTAAIADLAMSRFLSVDFTREHPDTVARIRAGLIATAADGYAGAGAAIRDMALVGRLPSLAVPVLVISGYADTSTPFEGHGEHLVANIPHVTDLRLDTGHLAPIEDPAGIATAIAKFFSQRDRI